MSDLLEGLNGTQTAALAREIVARCERASVCPLTGEHVEPSQHDAHVTAYRVRERIRARRAAMIGGAS